MIAAALLSAGTACAQFNASFVRQWGSGGSGNGQFAGVHSLNYSPIQRIYVADEAHHRIQYFTLNGTYLGQWGTWGYGTGEMIDPVSITFTPEGNVYVVERDNHRVHYFTPSGVHLGMWGSNGTNDGQFKRPSSAAFAPDGTLFVADRDNHRIQHFTTNGVFLGKFGSQGSGDGQMNEPMGVGVSRDGVVYVSDSLNRRIVYFNTNGTFLGKWGSVGSGDGQFGSSSAYNNGPAGFSFDKLGNIYIADPDNNRIQVYDAARQFLGSFGGYGTGNGRFYFPNLAACSPGWQVYVADESNNQVQQMTVTIGSATNAAALSWGLAGASWTMQVEALPDRNHVIKRSSDLQTWTTVWTTNTPAGLFDFTDASASGAARLFYKAE
jgi:tripartite motif-containing protein 71